MAIPKELWINAIEENLFASLEKILVAATEDPAEGKTIHVSEAGTSGTILMNPSRPLSVAERTDSDLSYDLDEWVMPARLVTFADKNQLSYDKMQSLLADVMGGLGNRVMRQFLINWYTGTTYKVDTTGSNYTAHATTATGNRKGLTLADIEDARKALNDQELPESDRFLLVDYTMSKQLRDDIGVSTYRDVAAGYDVNGGILPELAGFKIIEVPTVVYLTVAGVKREYGVAGAVTDSAAALAVHKSALSYAMGDINVFNNENDAIYAGDIISGAIWAGANYRRYSTKGVVPIMQATP